MLEAQDMIGWSKSQVEEIYNQLVEQYEEAEEAYQDNHDPDNHYALKYLLDITIYALRYAENLDH